MPECPRCHRSVSLNAIVCPTCQLTLKAHGHPGITLHRARGKEPLCLTCLYHQDDSCTYPQRPQAMDCTLYQPPIDQSTTSYPNQKGRMGSIGLRQNSGWFALLLLLFASFLLVLLSNR